MDDPLSQLYRYIEASQPDRSRPFITLTFAQSLDGSIAASRGERTALSGPESLQMTHRLRAAHDGILVGIGTILSDDPELTAREVPGDHPIPIVLDSHLRTSPTARVIRVPPAPWILCEPQAPASRRKALEGAGARVLAVRGQDDRGLDGPGAVQLLRSEGIERLMVEGGSRVISSFLGLCLADLLVLTIAPSFLGGLPAIAGADGIRRLPSLTNPHWLQLGQDMVLWGELQSEAG